MKLVWNWSRKINSIYQLKTQVDDRSSTKPADSMIMSSLHRSNSMLPLNVSNDVFDLQKNTHSLSVCFECVHFRIVFTHCILFNVETFQFTTLIIGCLPFSHLPFDSTLYFSTDSLLPIRRSRRMLFLFAVN